MRDIEKSANLFAYLRETRRVAPEECPRIQILAGGVANKTVLVERPNGEFWVLKQALPKLKVPPIDWFCSPARIEREAQGLRHLAQIASPGAITPLVFEDPAEHLLAMQAVPQPHQNWKTMLLAGDLQRDRSRQFGELLRAIHIGGTHLAQLFDDRTDFEALRLEPYRLHALIEETRATRFTVVHGDYSPKKILVHQNRLIPLDHEIIHFEDPAFDVSCASAHFLGKARHLGPSFWASPPAFGELTETSSKLPRALRHALACTLARAPGRSQLEYLTADEKQAQRAWVLQHLANPCAALH